MIIFLKLLIMIAGLTLPGYLFARNLRLEHSLAAAFPLSALFITESVLCFTMIGIPIRFITVAIFLTLIVTGSLLFNRIRLSTVTELPRVTRKPGMPLWLNAAILTFAATILITITLRTTLFPLQGLDTIFRWEGLARAMLQHQSLAFYPPTSASDFEIYLYPDGIPPLAATVYWWLYSVFGAPLPQLTSISICLQLSATMALTFYAARHAFNSSAAWFSLLTIAATPMLINGFAIGQETGFTALSVAGQFCFAWAAVRKPRLSTVVVAALFAALGSLARDYGPALAIAGFSVLAWHPSTRRYLATFVLTTAVFSLPWYIRSWVLTGNPFYSHLLPGGFEVNPVHVAIMDFYKETYALEKIRLTRWIELSKHLFLGGGLVFLAGVPYTLSRWRQAAPLLITIVLVTLLWLVSVGQTAGGIVYSTRVLTPAIVALAIAIGAALSRLYQSNMMQKSVVRRLTIAALFLYAGYSLATTAVYPSTKPYLFSSPTAAADGSFQLNMINQLQASNFPATGVLTDSPFFGEKLKQTSRFRPMMFWNPSVEFIFDQQLSTVEIQRRLVKEDVLLIFIDDKSTINKFLLRYNFFLESNNWRHLLDSPGEGAFFYFDP